MPSGTGGVPGKLRKNYPFLYDDPNAFDFVHEWEPDLSGLDQLVRFDYQYSNEAVPRSIFVGQLGNRVFVLNAQVPDPEQALSLMARRLAEN